MEFFGGDSYFKYPKSPFPSDRISGGTFSNLTTK